MNDAMRGEIERVAVALRRRVLAHVLASDGGYLSQCCSSAELLATLHLAVMHFGDSIAPAVPPPFAGVPGTNPAYANGAGYLGAPTPDTDRFVFSPAHYALVEYALLVELGRLDPAGLAQFNVDGSTVEMIGAEHSPGMATTTGSLGQALSQAAGMAVARRLKGDAGRVWVFMSDGEFSEGQTWEAFAVLAHHRVDNLGVYVDVNRQTCDGHIDTVLEPRDLAAKLDVFGARVAVVDGHDPAALAAPATAPADGRPLVVLAKTDPCRGVDLLKERAPRLHYLRFADADERARYADLLQTWGGAP